MTFWFYLFFFLTILRPPGSPRTYTPFPYTPPFRSDMSSPSRGAWEHCGELIDPHTACGLFAARTAQIEAATPVVTLATAHPAKFRDAVERATDRKSTRLNSSH